MFLDLGGSYFKIFNKMLELSLYRLYVFIIKFISGEYGEYNFFHFYFFISVL